MATSTQLDDDEGIDMSFLLNIDVSLNERYEDEFLSRDILEEYEDMPVFHIPKHPKTQSFLDMVWSKWEKFVADNKIDNQAFWKAISLDDDRSKQICLSFLDWYVRSSRVRRPCLGPKEWVMVQTVRCAVTVEDIWGGLVRNANEKILRPLTKTERQGSLFPDKIRVWDLAFGPSLNRSANGPAYEVAKAIPALSRRLGLSLKQTFTKREFTIQDILSVVDNLWVAAKDIICTPSIRMAYHCAVLLCGFGGWRPGSVVDLKYEDVLLAWVRDPQNPQKVGLAATITIHHVKQKKDKISRDQRGSMTFSVTFMESRQICILSLFIARALCDNAFYHDYVSPEQVLRERHFDDGNDFIPLKWKPEILKQRIVPISYGTFNKLWHRTLYVAGVRQGDRIVPYSLRVGAGRRLDNTFKGPLRNFILNNSTAVFEKSYQPVHVSFNLARAAFGDLADNSDELVVAMGRALARRDERAPLYITQEDLDHFNQRKDITMLRQQFNLMKRKNLEESQQIHRRMMYILERLTILRVAEIREKYFDEVDSLRANGESTKSLAGLNATNPRPTRFVNNPTVASGIGFLLRQDVVSPKSFIEKLLGYLAENPYSVVFPEEEDRGPDMPTKAEAVICFLCNKEFTTKFNLNRHVGLHHRDTFERPFSCPECLKAGEDCQIPADPFAWSNHVQRCHGAYHTPNPKKWFSEETCPEPGADTKEGFYMCFLCKSHFKFKRNLNRHVNDYHKDAFGSAFFCPECKMGGKECEVAAGPLAWSYHVERCHGKSHAPTSRNWFAGDGLKTDRSMKSTANKRKAQSEGVELDNGTKKMRHA
ncbi:hypothetical protein HDV57DRAFT_349635 [Trichoderma longibrachiatum]